MNVPRCVKCSTCSGKKHGIKSKTVLDGVFEGFPQPLSLYEAVGTLFATKLIVKTCAMKITRKMKLITGAILAVTTLPLAGWFSVPAAAISPEAGENAVPLGRPLEIDVSPLATITKLAVYADDQLLGMEYNLEPGDQTREFDLKPGQQVRVETKVTSVLGFTREFVTTFATVTPIAVQSITANGVRLVPGQKIPPQTALVFEFNKPVSQASVSLDGGGPIDLQVDATNPKMALMPPTVSLKQGENHILALTVTGTDFSATGQPIKIQMPVIKPLTFYGKASEGNGTLSLELNASAALLDPQAVKSAITTTIPGASIRVEKQKVIIAGTGWSRTANYNISVANAQGVDGSFLEKPLTLTLAFQSDQAAVITASGASGSTTYRYVYSGGETPGQTEPAAAAASGPPPGWPDCCPWPPEQ